MKQAIILVSFGVAEKEARKNSLEALAEDIRRAFPGQDLFQAYTSAFLRKRLRRDGVDISSLEECLEELAGKGCYEQVLVQPAHLTAGEEYSNKILSPVRNCRGNFPKLLLGEPLFFHAGEGGSRDDYAEGLHAIWDVLGPEKGEEVVLLGHGSPHRHNPVYELLQERADVRKLPLHIGVLEEADTPDFPMVLERLSQRHARKILLAPLLFSGGMHVTEDMAGGAPSSWKSRLEKEGFSLRLSMKGMGEYPAFRRLYLQKLQRLAGGSSS